MNGRQILATAAALALVFTAPAFADGHGHGHDHARGHGEHHTNAKQRARFEGNMYHNGRRGYSYGNIWYPIGQGPYPSGTYYPYGRDNEQGDDDDQGGPHGCVNPAGHERGWCKHERGDGYSNNGYGYGNQEISGIVTALSGSRITILAGLRAINIDASRAYNAGRVSGVGIGSTITAYGSYNGNTFYATSIR